MLFKCFNWLIKFLSKISGKQITSYRKTSSIPGKTAAKSKFGFWCVGNVLDRADIAYGILENGLVEKEYTQLVLKTLRNLLVDGRDHLVFYDVGANIGYYGILSAYVFKDKIKVFNFEPISEHVECLNEAIKINGLSNNSLVMPVALGEKTAELEMVVSGSGSTLVNGFMGGDIDMPKRKVRVEFLDSLWQRGEIELPDFIKIDVEGFEYEVLKGAQEIIQKNQPVIFYETVDVFSENGFKNKNYDATVKILSDWGYDLYYLSDNIWKKIDNYRADKIEMFLCLHREKHANLVKSL